MEKDGVAEEIWEVFRHGIKCGGVDEEIKGRDRDEEIGGEEEILGVVDLEKGK